jgi:hypothetical protein
LLFVQVYESASFRIAALPESSQLDELINQVAALQGSSHFSVSFSFHLSIFILLTSLIAVSRQERKARPPTPE